MLLLPTTETALPAGAFADHWDPRLAHCLADGLALARRADGRPELLVLRLRSGAGAADAALTLTLRLALRPPAAALVDGLGQLGLRAVPVAYERARYRLRLRSPLGEGDLQAGDWRAAALSSGGVAATAVHLTPHEGELLSRLLEGGAPTLEAEADLRYIGLAPALPWLVSAPGPALAADLAARLGDGPHTADAVVAAFLALPLAGGLLRAQALDPAAPEPSAEALLVELSRRALADLFAPAPRDDPFAPAAYTLRAPAELPAELGWDLLAPRREERAQRLVWSAAELVPDLADAEGRARIFPVAADLDLFGQREVLVVNYLPIEPHALRELRVDARYLGAGGVPESRSLRFTGEAETQRLAVTYAATAGFRLDYRATCVLAPPGGAGWPTLLRGDYRPAEGSVAAVDAEGLGLVRAEAEPRAFERCSAVEVELRAAGSDAAAAPLARLELTAARPSAWAALREPGAAVEARCAARPPAGAEGGRAQIWSGPVAGGVVRVAAHQLDVAAPEPVALSVDPGGPPCAYLGVELAPAAGPEPAEGRLITLEPGAPRAWRVFRESVFAPPRLRFRLHYVLAAADGRTQPMRVTPWQIAEGPTLAVRPPDA